MDEHKIVGNEESLVWVDTGSVRLEANLGVPLSTLGIVVFAHGSGSSRLSPRNQYIARMLRGSGFATLLLDLLTEDEARVDEQTGHLRFDLELLAGRLIGATEWLARQPATRALRVGYFGASTGAGAALIAAAQRPDDVFAVVSRGGRPDLAGSSLARVEAPTLLIVGGDDPEVLALNERAQASMRAPCELAVVPGAGHLFEEPGALEQVGLWATNWFSRHVRAAEAQRQQHARHA